MGRIDVTRMSKFGDAYYYKDDTGASYRVTSQSAIRRFQALTGEKKAGKARAISASSADKTQLGRLGRSPVSKRGNLKAWGKPLAAKGGYVKNGKVFFGNYNFRSVNFGERGQLYGTQVSQKGVGGGPSSGGSLKGMGEWARHFRLVSHQMMLNAEYFRILVGYRALKVFKSSFAKERLAARGAEPWKPLAEFTRRKRAARGRKPDDILDEYGDLKRSLAVKESVGLGYGYKATQVYTKEVKANPGKHKKNTLCYAGWHNEGEGTYGRGWKGHPPKPYVRRQFIGHTDKLDPFSDSFMRKMMKLYLFDSVFLVKQG